MIHSVIIFVALLVVPAISYDVFVLMSKRVARTFILGGLLNADMAEDVHRCARECGTVCSITYPLPKEELEYHGEVISAVS